MSYRVPEFERLPSFIAFSIFTLHGLAGLAGRAFFDVSALHGLFRGAFRLKA